MAKVPLRDRVLALGANPWARSAARTLGLPSLPVELPRTSLARETGYLRDGVVEVAAVRGGAPLDVLARTVEEADGRVRIWHATDAVDTGPAPAQCLVLDGTGLQAPRDLGDAFEFLHPRVRGLSAGGRVIVVARPLAAGMAPRTAAARGALDGLMRSLGKELGRKGATANMLVVEEGAEARLAAPIRFLTGRRSVFVDLQVIHVGNSVPGHAAGPWGRPLTGKTALVTGAARGIGAAIARVLASEGAHVIGLDRAEEEVTLERVVGPLNGSKLLLNLLAEETPVRATRMIEAHGGVDIVVHNAGITRDKTLAGMTRSQWDEVLETNLEGVIRLDEAVRQRDLLREGGRLVYVSSVSGIAGNFGQTNYAASKAGLIGYVGALAPALAPRGVTVNAVAPGFIETEMTAAMPASFQRVARRLSALNQGGLPEDVGEVVTFLATPAACGISGQVIRVCGGGLIGA
jgi:3-oxoacyl-[acyl-carrier protein] reductase